MTNFPFALMAQQLPSERQRGRFAFFALRDGEATAERFFRATTRR